MKLTAKIIAIVYLAVAVLAGAGGYLTIRNEMRNFKKQQEDRALALNLQSSEKLRKAWEDGGGASAKSALARSQFEIRHSQMRWVQFDVAAHHTDAPRAPAQSLRQVASAGQVTSVIVRNGDDAGWLHTYLPVSTDARIKGWTVRRPVAGRKDDAWSPSKPGVRRSFVSSMS